MVQLADLNVSDNHPLALELISLRTTVARFQDEAHTTSIKLQRHSLDTARANDRLLLLERENDILRKEVAVLRANPHPDTSPDSHPAASQVRQLTLSLRQLSDKLSHTEEALLTRTTELARALSKVKKAKHAADDVNQVTTRILHREESHTLKERDLRLRLRTAEEQIKMSDLVVREYAGLVRNLEGKLGVPSRSGHGRSALSKTEDDISQGVPGPSHTRLGGSLEEGKLGLQRLVSEFADESERLQAEIMRLQNELTIAKAQIEAQKQITEQHCLELAKTQTELQKLKIDDNTAAKMVSRYMKFSQASTDALQGTLSSLKARHAATINTLSAQISSLTSQLQDAEVTHERLRGALDELGGDYMKESYGRRREVALRIKLINREESLMESLRRWVLRAQENLGKPQDASPQESLTRMVNEAKGILSHSDSPVDGSPSGSLARIISAQMSAGSLVKELHTETARRLELQTALAVGQQNQDPSGINKDSCQENGTQYEVSSSSVAIQASLLPSDEPTVVSPLVINIPSIGPILSFDHPNAIKEQLYTDHIPNGDDVLRTSLKGGINTSEAVPGEDDTRPATTAETGPEEGQVEGHKLVKDKHPVDAIDHTELEIPGAMVAQGRDVAAQTSVPEIVVGHAEEVPQSLLLSVDDGPPAARSEEPYTDINTVNSNPSVIRNESMQQLTLDLQPRPQHPLLTDLTKVNHRYDELQRAFHDCHFALDALKQSLTTTPLNNRIPPDALKLALERLNDYIEDARVELEIRIADESLLARGYETLLSVPGALTSPDPRSIGGGAEDPTPSRSEIEEQIEAFVSGIEPGVQKAQENLTRKLSDVQHDIAILKRAIHDQEGEASTVLSEGFIPSSPTPGPVPATAPVVGSRNGGWASWIHSPSSRPSSPAPTFGNIMTSPRLRHSPSLNLPGIARPGKPYVLSNTEASKDPLASLGLRVPMPMFMPSQATLHPTPRSRTVPTMYMIGLGARTTSGSLTSLLSPQRTAELPKEDDGVGDVE